MLQHEGVVGDDKAGALEQRLYVLHAEEPDVRAVEQAPIVVVEIIGKQAGQDRRVRSVRERDDDAPFRLQERCRAAERCPGIQEVFEHVGDDDVVESAIRDALLPGRVVQVAPPDLLAEDPEISTLFSSISIALTRQPLNSLSGREIEPGPAPISRTSLSRPTNRRTFAAAVSESGSTANR